MPIRAICTDIDGTLLNSDRQLSSRTISIMSELGAKVPVILASSRMPSAMTHLQRELKIEGHPLICYNGSYILIFENGTAQPFTNIGIPPDICNEILTLAKGTGIHVSIYQNDEWYAPQQDQWTEREARITKVNPILRKGEDVVATLYKNYQCAHKVMCMGDAEEIDRMEKQLNAQLSDGIHIYRSRPTYLELAVKAVTKATALQMLCEHVLNIDIGDVMAFGDNYNDTDMLQAAGYGVAVANARDEVKQAAKMITKKSTDDGVAEMLEQYRNHFQA